MTQTKNEHPELDTTRIVNIWSEKFVWYINNQPMELEVGEVKVKPVYVAQIGAKHLVDLILQKEHGVKNTLQDTPLRRSLFAKILPDMAASRDIKPLSPDEEKKAIAEQLKKQTELIQSFFQQNKEREEKRDKEMEELKKTIEELKASQDEPNEAEEKSEEPQEEKPKPKGRPKKATSQ